MLGDRPGGEAAFLPPWAEGPEAPLAPDLAPPEPLGAGTMPFFDHVAELRSRLMRALIAIGLGACLLLAFHTELVAWLRLPLLSTGLGTKLIATAPTEYLVAVLKICTVGGLGLTLPYVLYQGLAFIHPGLTPQERRWVLPLSLGGSLSFALGMAFGFWVMLPAGLSFLIGFSGAEVETMLSVGRYLGFASMVVLSCGLAFELPLVMLAAAAAGLVTSHVLAPLRREAMVACLAIAAVISPSIDLVSQLVMGGTLYLLFELGLILQRAIGR